MKTKNKRTMAFAFIIGGFVLLIIGLILYFVPNLFSWFGKLPGDIRIIKENSRVYIPITSMVLISVVLTLLLNLIRWIKDWFNF
jgi:predicted PurR-regulated permease PerM